MRGARGSHEVPRLASLADLRPAPYNPRTIDPAAAEGLGKSLVEFGDISGIVWNGRTGHLVAGHQRVAELVKAHGDDLPIQDGAVVTPDGRCFGVRVVDWPEARERAANVTANNPLLAGEWTGGLGEVLAQIEAEDAALYAALRLDDLAVAEGVGGDAKPFWSLDGTGRKGGDEAQRQDVCVSLLLRPDDVDAIEGAVLRAQAMGSGDTTRAQALSRVCAEWLRGQA